MSARAIPSVILFAEDNADDALLLERVVQLHFPRHRLIVVRNGEEAIAYLGGQGAYADRTHFPYPQLVILDLGLPKKSGLDVLAWIREQPRHRGTIVLMLTEMSSQEDMKRAYELHANSFLHKRPLLQLSHLSKGILEYWLNLNQCPDS